MSEEEKIVHHDHQRGHPHQGDSSPPSPPVVQIVHRHHESGHPHHHQDDSDNYSSPPPPPPVVQIVHRHHESGHPHHHQDDSDNYSLPPPPPVVQIVHHHHVPQYGTFDGIPQSPAIGFPQPVPPRRALDPSHYHSHGYQAVPGYVVAEGQPMRNWEQELHHRLPCCGIGYGWFLFIIGFFLAGIPWGVGAVELICCNRIMDPREKPGYVVCTVAALFAIIIAVIFGVADWL